MRNVLQFSQHREAWLLRGAVASTLILGLGYCLLPPTAALGLTVGLACLGLMMVSPYAGLLFFLALLYLRPAEHFPVLAAFHLTRLTALVALGVWGIQYALTRRPPLAHAPQNWMLAGLSGAVFLSTLGAEYWRIPIYRFLEVFLKCLVLYWLIINLLDTPRRLRGFLWAWVLLTAFNGGLALHHYFAGLGLVAGERVEGVGIFGDPNDLALSFVVVVPLVVALWRAEKWPILRGLWATVLGLLLAGVRVTFSRGGLLGLLVALFLTLRERIRRPAARWAFYLFGGLIAAALVHLTFQERGTPFTQVTLEQNVAGRLAAWKAGARMMLDKPLTGVGYGYFADRFKDYAPPDTDVYYLTAHNSFVLVAGEMGLPGLLFFGGLLLVSFRSLREIKEALRTRSGPAELREIGEALRPSLWGWLTCGMFLSQAFGYFLYILLGVIVATHRLCTEPTGSGS